MWIKKSGWLSYVKNCASQAFGASFKKETSFTHPDEAYDILLHVLLQEQSHRLVYAKQNRIRAANFPKKKLLEELEEAALPEQA